MANPTTPIEPQTLVTEGIRPTWERHVDEHLDFDQASHAVAEAMARFDAYVANIQGACDTGTFETMVSAARHLYEEAAEG